MSAKRVFVVVVALAFMIVITSSSDKMVAAARIPAIRSRELADCNSPIQGEISAGCGSSGGSGGSSKPKTPSGSTPGSSLCKKGCCGKNKFGDCVCCQ